MEQRPHTNTGAPHHNQHGTDDDQRHSANEVEVTDTTASRASQQAATRDAATQKLEMDKAQRDSEARHGKARHGAIPAQSETVTDPIDAEAKAKYPEHQVARDNRTLGIPTSDEQAFDESLATEKADAVVQDDIHPHEEDPR